VDEGERRLPPEGDEGRADEGFDGVGENRVLVPAAGQLFALAEQDVLADAVPARDRRQSARVDHGRAHLGQLALRQIRVVVEQRFGGHEAEHGIAEELEALIGGDPTGLEGEGTMRERETKSLGINVDPETLLQC
jgi:hypothetical protein